MTGSARFCRTAGRAMRCLLNRRRERGECVRFVASRRPRGRASRGRYVMGVSCRLRARDELIRTVVPL
ncbi:molybdopterin biosynthesis MoeA domain protein [Burkholderia pseudomallei MSHR2451]|nr:molybdopterin biosynthesis MoeA domain protein [Burkholderia pseudomallei MSHR2451]